jgi:hypothetical protein
MTRYIQLKVKKIISILNIYSIIDIVSFFGAFLVSVMLALLKGK